MFGGPQNLFGYNAEENNPARSNSCNFINIHICERFSRVRVYKQSDDAKFYKVVFEKLTQSGFTEVTKLNLYSVLALVKVK
jgi:hypothetical protein